MNCPLKFEETSGLLLDYCAGTLAPADMAAVERHMDLCAGCAAFRVEQASVWDALDSWEAPAVSADFGRRLWQRIDAGERTPWHVRFAEVFRAGLWKPAVPLTLATLVIAAGFLFDHGRPPAATGISLNEAEQVEQTLDDIQLLEQFDTVAVSEVKAL